MRVIRSKTGGNPEDTWGTRGPYSKDHEISAILLKPRIEKRMNDQLEKSRGEESLQKFHVGGREKWVKSKGLSLGGGMLHGAVGGK